MPSPHTEHLHTNPCLIISSPHAAQIIDTLHPVPSLTIHFVQDKFIRGNVQLSKLQWLLKTRTTPLERDKQLMRKDTGKEGENTI